MTHLASDRFLIEKEMNKGKVSTEVSLCCYKARVIAIAARFRVKSDHP